MSELFLKEEKVLTLKDIDGVPREVQRVDNPELLPICLRDNCTTELFYKWLDSRNIPKTREGLKAVTEQFGEDWLINKNFASLSDHYWIKKRSETWKKVNFFTRIYNKSVGDMFFKPWALGSQKKIDNDSPDLTTGGILMKRWFQNSDKSSFLVKAGSVESHQEPLSEVLVSVLAEKLEIIPCVKYDLWVEGVTICSKSDNIVTLDTELVPASMLYNLIPKEDSESVYAHLIKVCEAFNIPGAKEFIDGMIFIDNITGNEDRNLSNIAFIRDINTMKFIGPAPLFDSGNAYWSTKKITDTVKSNMFGDVEGAICAELKKKYNLEELTHLKPFYALINSYPAITDEKKENLIEAIKKRNNRLCGQDFDIGAR